MGTVLVYITPASGIGGELPTPIRFDMKYYTMGFIRAYADACVSQGQKVRIVWKKK